MRASRRGVLKGASALGASTLLSAASPDLFRGAAQLLTWSQTYRAVQGTKTVAAFTAGSGSQQIGLRTEPGIAPDGANALAARRDGSIAVLDTINRRVAIVRASSITQQIPLRGAIYPRDIFESNGNLYVLDAAGDQILEVIGTSVRAHPLPRASRSGASGLTAGTNGNRVAVVEEDAYTYGLDHGRGARDRSFPDSTGVVRVAYARDTLDRQSARVDFGSASATLQTRGPLGSAVPAGRDDNGNLYVVMSELMKVPGGGIGVDLTVRRFGPDGSARGATRVPVRGRTTSPTRPVTIAPNGDAFALYTEQAITRIVSLEWTQTLAALPPTLRLPQWGIAAAVQQIPGCRSNTTSIAYDNYYNYPWWCTWANIATTVPGGTNGCGGYFPTYITGQGQYWQLPYSWGGWADDAGFQASMNAGKQAGNYSNTFLSCTDGLDCSGLVGRCWGITGTRYADWQLVSNFCTNTADIDPGNPPPWMQRGDVYDLWNSHIRMHDIYASVSTGPYVYESAALNGDRVWYSFYSWNSLDPYTWCIGNFTC
jgi:cell wall-associated NlpC family hydrolase